MTTCLGRSDIMSGMSAMITNVSLQKLHKLSTSWFDTMTIHKNSLQVLINIELDNLSLLKTSGIMPSGAGDIFLSILLISSRTSHVFVIVYLILLNCSPKKITWKPKDSNYILWSQMFYQYNKNINIFLAYLRGPLRRSNGISYR